MQVITAGWGGREREGEFLRAVVLLAVFCSASLYPQALMFFLIPLLQHSLGLGGSNTVANTLKRQRQVDWPFIQHVSPESLQGCYVLFEVPGFPLLRIWHSTAVMDNGLLTLHTPKGTWLFPVWEHWIKLTKRAYVMDFVCVGGGVRTHRPIFLSRENNQHYTLWIVGGICAF